MHRPIQAIRTLAIRAIPKRRSGVRERVSLETILAVGLCGFVLAASAALIETDKQISKSMRDLPAVAHTPPGLLSPLERNLAQRRPRLMVFVSLDGLRPDRLDFLGHDRRTTPRLTELAAESVVFSTVGAQSSQPLTSHKSILTGKYPSTLLLETKSADLVVLANLDAPQRFLVEAFGSVEGSLAVGMRETGYSTAAFTDGGWFTRDNGFAHGFDSFDDSPGGLATLVPRVEQWLQKVRSQHAFLYVRSRELAGPYDSPEPHYSRFCETHDVHGELAALCADPDPSASSLSAIAAHYDGAVSAADEELGRLLDGLRALDAYDEALILVTAAHGEALGERGRVGHGGLFVEELSVPLVAKFPRSWNVPAEILAEPVELVDILPTLFALGGSGATGDVDGRSLLPILFRGVRGHDHLSAQTSFVEAGEMHANPARRTLFKPGHWQIIHDARIDAAEYYDLGSPGSGPRMVAGEEFPRFVEALLHTDGPPLEASATSEAGSGLDGPLR